MSRYMFGYVVTGNTYLDIWICCYRSVTVSRYVFGYVVTGLC